MYQNAGVVGLLRTVLIIILVYYGIRLISRFILPLIFRSAFKNNNFYSSQNQEKKESRNKKRQKDSSLGEYVDFEEVKDPKKNEK